MIIRNFKTIGIIGRHSGPRVAEAIDALSHHLRRKQIEVLIDDSTAALLRTREFAVVSRAELGRRCDLAVIIGGDGTLLNAARSLADFNVPLVGINLGYLGFLADISPHDMMACMDDILEGKYQSDERFLLHVVIERDGEVVSESDALNEVVVHKWNVARMIELETYIDGQFVNKLRADGIIVATPTGSTAYALSAGGPILYPGLDAIVVVPVCPHTMSNRPIVIGGDSRIEVIVCNGPPENSQTTCDGQITLGLMGGDRIKIFKKEQPVRLLHPARHDHFQILRAKLHWAETPTIS
jgi:NAD+ kinase